MLLLISISQAFRNTLVDSRLSKGTGPAGGEQACLTVEPT